ncbi:hypothetical protein BKK47_11340 [Rodentibacter mrazii]|uniref:Uncharacterized protein n=1 Tax=Rodentibacter mrazii TaxID=1908257 RepID=A0A1V3IA87_9PAST|nr:hypothetical protein [Rodentibacter mrazii]OOF37042.1 hypothetical protein BKK47_11340 [Rodentibacter mrazii]
MKNERISYEKAVDLAVQLVPSHYLFEVNANRENAIDDVVYAMFEIANKIYFEINQSEEEISS